MTLWKNIYLLISSLLSLSCRVTILQRVKAVENFHRSLFMDLVLTSQIE